jgi:hypothetical protein
VHLVRLLDLALVLSLVRVTVFVTVHRVPHVACVTVVFQSSSKEEVEDSLYQRGKGLFILRQKIHSFLVLCNVV